MFQPWRVMLRQAEDAVARGQLDEASRILAQGELRLFQPSRQLQAELAQKLAQRGRERATRGETQAGWRDWETAVSLGAAAQSVEQLEAALVEQSLAEAAGYLAASQPQLALTRLDELGRRRGELPAARKLRHAAGKVEAALASERQGKFTDAELHWESAMALEPQLTTLTTRRDAARRNAAQWRGLSHKLHELLAAAEPRRWNEVLTLADEMLALAPEDAPARDARRRAWAAVGTPLPDSAAPPRRAVPPPLPGAAPKPVAASLATQPGERCLLWVDAVGGYLVCWGDTVVIGQPSSQHPVDVPILADLSTRHAVIRRSGEGYVLEPVRAARVDGRPAEGPVMLTDGSTIELGEAVKLRFRRPHALSATARLEFLSRHRTQPPTDGVLLAAESLVLGPSTQSHVVCPSWSNDAVLFRSQGRLHCRMAGALEIDGKLYEGAGPLTPTSRVVNDEAAFSLEPWTG